MNTAGLACLSGCRTSPHLPGLSLPPSLPRSLYLPAQTSHRGHAFLSCGFLDETGEVPHHPCCSCPWGQGPTCSKRPLWAAKTAPRSCSLLYPLANTMSPSQEGRLCLLLDSAPGNGVSACVSCCPQARTRRGPRTGPVFLSFQ